MFALYTLASPQLDEITTRVNWKTKKHSPVQPNYFWVLPSTITHSQMEAQKFPGLMDAWMGGRAGGRAGERVGGGWMVGWVDAWVNRWCVVPDHPC